MRNTPQRLRSYAPLPGTKFLSGVPLLPDVASWLYLVCAIHRSGTDQFIGNVLFAVFFVLSIGLYCGSQSVIEDVFNRLQSLFRRREVMVITETTTSEQIAIPTIEEPEPSLMKCSAPVQEIVTDNYPEMTFPNDYMKKSKKMSNILHLKMAQE